MNIDGSLEEELAPFFSRTPFMYRRLPSRSFISSHLPNFHTRAKPFHAHINTFCTQVTKRSKYFAYPFAKIFILDSSLCFIQCQFWTFSTNLTSLFLMRNKVEQLFAKNFTR
jgi:hypothetical protein